LEACPCCAETDWDVFYEKASNVKAALAASYGVLSQELTQGSSVISLVTGDWRSPVLRCPGGRVNVISPPGVGETLEA
jgi:hypothetical protein